MSYVLGEEDVESLLNTVPIDLSGECKPDFRLIPVDLGRVKSMFHFRGNINRKRNTTLVTNIIKFHNQV